MTDLVSKNPKFIELFLLFIFFFSVHIPNLIVNKSKNVPFLIGDDRYYKAMVVSIINDHDLFLENNSQHWLYMKKIENTLLMFILTT